ncbi:hypothetical protein [Bacillus timonensis]|nr:hypothetical protein [Bacillus timonensis]
MLTNKEIKEGMVFLERKESVNKSDYYNKMRVQIEVMAFLEKIFTKKRGG